MYVDTDKENCERYRQNDRENQQYNRTFRLVHTNSNLLVLRFRFNGLHNLKHSPYDKDGKRDEKDHAEPIHRPMERLYE